MITGPMLEFEQTSQNLPLLSDEARRLALLELLHEVDQIGYDFIAPTPASQARVMARPDRQVGHSLTDLLGWSLPCVADSVSPAVIDSLEGADLLERRSDGLVGARIRVSRIFDNLFIHSPFPTMEQDAVFLGPDSHRFADFILRNLADMPPCPRVLDYGAGAGVGGITVASVLNDAKLTFADVNPKALCLAATNAFYAGLDFGTVDANAPAELDGPFDVVVMHPPFMIDVGHRAYRDGGDLYGGRFALDWAIQGMLLLAPGGRLVMHTGVSIVAGRDVVRDAFSEALPDCEFTLSYCLLDPDIFGEELETKEYAEVDRIAAVGICIDRAH